ncbi:hypothetical protein OB905_13795 [Halobacteria archaeon AArc-dxtr1]|nr:hypothetical protein [Halobacteria archaeon AArc-dxtr1]
MAVPRHGRARIREFPQGGERTNPTGDRRPAAVLRRPPEEIDAERDALRALRDAA